MVIETSISRNNLMKTLIEYINKKHKLTAIPINIIGAKRWASDDSLFKQEKLEGIPQRIKLSEKKGIILYDWNIVEDSIIEDIKNEWKKINES